MISWRLNLEIESRCLLLVVRVVVWINNKQRIWLHRVRVRAIRIKERKWISLILIPLLMTIISCSFVHECECKFLFSFSDLQVQSTSDWFPCCCWSCWCWWHLFPYSRPVSCRCAFHHVIYLVHVLIYIHLNHRHQWVRRTSPGRSLRRQCRVL